MKSTALLAHLAALLTLDPADVSADAPDSGHLPSEELRWSIGPTTVSLQEVARLRVPEGLAFLAADQSKVLLESLGNRTSGNEVGIVASRSHDWSVVIEFHEVGYVSEAGWSSLDPTVILDAIRASDQGANPGREQRGWPTVEVRDWESAPRYDPAAHTMEWAVRATSNGGSVINRVISVLARRGVVRFVLVERQASPAAVAQLRRLARGLEFEPGERYVDHQPEDPVAAGGLIRLVSNPEAPALLEGTRDSSDAEGRGKSPSATYWWLAMGMTGVAGFLAGRGFRRRRRVGQRPAVPAMQGSVVREGAVELTAAVRRTLPLERTEGTPAAGGAGSMPATPANTARFRRRRWDAYSFYARLTRDLHWTIRH